MRRVLFYVLPDEAELSLGRLLQRRLPAVPRGKLKSLLIRGEVKLAGKMQRDSQAPLRASWSVQLAVPGNLGNSPQTLQLDPTSVLHQDKDLLVVEKPHSVKVHRNHPGETVETMMEAAQALVNGEEIFLVHRLDRGTSGILVFARSKEVAANLGRQFARQKVKKTYLALVQGIPPAEGVVDQPLYRSSGRALFDAQKGKSCQTRYTVLGSSQTHSLVRCEPLSGRFHQVRAHMAWLGCPLAGDLLYGGYLGIRGSREVPPLDLPGAMLHCLALEFALPGSGKRMEFRTRFPGRFRTAVRRAGIPFRDPDAGEETRETESDEPKAFHKTDTNRTPRKRPQRTPLKTAGRSGRKKPTSR